MKVSPLSPFQSPLLPPLPVLLPFPLSTSVLLKFNKINNSKNKPFTNITHMYLLVLYITNVTCILKLYYCFQDIFLVLKNFLFFISLTFSFPFPFLQFFGILEFLHGGSYLSPSPLLPLFPPPPPAIWMERNSSQFMGILSFQDLEKDFVF